MARKLNEKIALDKTVDRLSRNLINFDDTESLIKNYFNAVKPHFDDETIMVGLSRQIFLKMKCDFNVIIERYISAVSRV